MRPIRKLAVVLLTLIALATGSLLAGGAQGGATSGHSGKGQYSAKPDCGPDNAGSAAGKEKKLRDCLNPPGQRK